MEKLQQSGRRVVPITGRPAGWCDHIARMWPVDGLVGENGAFYFYYDRLQRKMVRRYARSEADRRRDRQKLDALAATILAQVPGAAVAADQSFRVADLAIDFCEDVPALPFDQVLTIAALFEAAGATAKISSIHVNGWFGDYDKLTMSKCLFSEVFGEDLDLIRNEVVFVGDSPNDVPMFAFFPNAVGVANIRHFEGMLEARPAWVAGREGGQGFAEVAAALLET
ncbi:MAG: HAD family hydrolase [Parvularculaceae bacterium]|nr:HAD family hydrolase [Parvularculaceae bacterium]